jgi:hypothetical protein
MYGTGLINSLCGMCLFHKAMCVASMLSPYWVDWVLSGDPDLIELVSALVLVALWDVALCVMCACVMWACSLRRDVPLRLCVALCGHRAHSLDLRLSLRSPDCVSGTADDRRGIAYCVPHRACVPLDRGYGPITQMSPYPKVGAHSGDCVCGVVALAHRRYPITGLDCVRDRRYRSIIRITRAE